jgi:hypothetical protein
MAELLRTLARWFAAMSPYALAALLGLLVVLALASIGVAAAVLLWWAGWTTRRSAQHASASPAAPALAPPSPPHAAYLVYFSGIGHISGEYLTRYEDAFLAAIAAQVPGVAVVRDIFPFSVNNQAMTSERLLGWFWGWVSAQRARRGRLKFAGDLILLRNILYTAVSADRRYGPIYNYSVAELTLQSLLRQGYRLGSGAPLTLLGYSGGGQVALATAGYLKATLHVPVQVISLGGVINTNPALDRIDALYHLYGTRDMWQRFGKIIFPSRWRLAAWSRWNRGIAGGWVKLICTGPMVHQGRRSYMDATATLDGGPSYLAHTAGIIAELVRQFTPHGDFGSSGGAAGAASPPSQLPV